MGKSIGIAVAIIVGLMACNREQPPNHFSDPVLVRIADLQDRRVADSLYQFLTSPQSGQRSAAALALASIQDSSSSRALGSLLLEDTSITVRSSAAFALGQTGGLDAVNALIPALNDQHHTVVREALEALGRCISARDLNALLEYKTSDTLTQEGLAWGFYRLALRNTMDSIMVSVENEFLNPGYNSSTRLAAAHFFNQSGGSSGNFEKNLIRAALYDSSPEVRIAAAGGLRKLKNDNALAALKEILTSEKDYRVRVNAARSLRVFPMETAKDLMTLALHDEHPAVAIACSEIVQTMLKTADARILEEARSAKIVRVQANLYKAVFATGPYSPQTVEEVKQKYADAKGEYEKAAWLGSLSAVAGAYLFIYKELMQATGFVIRSTAAQALTDIDRRSDFPPARRKEMSELYVQAIAKADPAVVGIVSEALSDPSLGYIKVIADHTFLYEARKKLQLPRDIESLQPLENAIAYFEGKPKPTPLKNGFNHPIDWKRVMTIDRDQRVLVQTTRGDIVLRLLVEEAPGSVVNFVNLVETRYFDTRVYHRVVPNFVIQTGCNRGDGFGSEDYSIRSEFSRRRYSTGSVGMASAGKDTEGTQWFVTHSPTPHLDTRYTLFAVVEKGMEIIDQIEVGDRNTTLRLIGN